MAKVITFGIQKGGCAKSISAAITSWILSEDHKVLCIDMDSQGNLTEVFLQVPMRTLRLNSEDDIFKAIEVSDPRPYIREVRENLHIIPGSEYMSSLFIEWLYNNFNKKDRLLQLRRTLDVVKDDYDYIIIDTPPALSDNLCNALAASDGVVMMFDMGQFCYSAIPSFMEVIEATKGINPSIRNLGILPVKIDNRRSDNKDFLAMLQDTYGDMVFDTIIKQQASIGRLAYAGFTKNPEVNEAVKQYRPFIKELINRVSSR